MNTMNRADAEVSLILVRTFPVRPARVFRAWTDPALIADWLAPGELCAQAEVDARVGGRYRITMRSPDGALHITSGEYLEVVPDRRIVKTWRWEGDDAITRVTVELHERVPGTTEMTLRHERFVDQDARDRHAQGWNGCLPKLDRLLSR